MRSLIICTPHQTSVLLTRYLYSSPDICIPHQISVFLTRYHSVDQIKRNEKGRACSTYGGEGRRYLVGKPEGKRQFGRTMRRWEDSIKMDLQEVRWRAWIGSIWIRIGTGG
jgi:hypothetical protein